MATESRTALVIVMSAVTTDPRVRRQIDWLTQAGWTVDSIGPGDHHVPEVRDHFALTDPARWTRTKIGSAVVYALLPMMTKFRVLLQNRIPSVVQRRVAHGHYDLVVFNDHHFLPWIADSRVFSDAALEGHIHLDLHEYVPAKSQRGGLWHLFAAPFFDWRRSFIGHPRFDTRSTVVRAIGELYAEEFGFADPAVIRNCPPYVDQEPTPVAAEEIRLLHHGAANHHRGLYEMIDAMRLVEDRFSLTLILMGSEERVAQYVEYAKDLGDRVRFVDPVPMQEISTFINSYDLEIMFYRPRNRNLELALPNKLFEAVQGRLGLVIGESPMMEEVVRQYDNGLIVPGWSSKDLAEALNTLTADRVQRLKDGSAAAAKELSAESESGAFFNVIGASRS